MTVHPLFQDSVVLILIAEWLIDTGGPRSLCAFAKTFVYAHAPANAVLYRSLDIARGATPARYDPRRVCLLLRTFHFNRQLALMVRRVKTNWMHVAQVVELLHVCEAVRAVHLDLDDAARSGTYRRAVPVRPWPKLPPHIHSLTISHVPTGSPHWMDEFLQKCVTTSHIRTLQLSLRAGNKIAGQILSVSAPQLLKLRLIQGNDPVSWLVAKFAPASFVNLRYLRVCDFNPHVTGDALLHIVAPNLQRLTIERAAFPSLEILFECLREDEWCPNLLGLPLILIIRVDAIPAQKPFVGTADLEAQWARARSACLGRSVWNKPAAQFDRLLERILEVERRYQANLMSW